MIGRKIKLYELPSALYLKNTPVLIADGALLLDRFTEKVTVQLKMRSVDEREILSVSVCIRPFDATGEQYATDVEYTYSGLKLTRDKEFGTGRQIEMPDGNVRSFTAFISAVTFSDYSTWQNKALFGAIGKARTLEDALGGEEVAKQFTARYGSDCVIFPSDEKTVWYCTCGAINHVEEERCHNCRRNRTALQAVNYESLRSEAARRAESEKEEGEAERLEREQKKKREKKIFRIAMIVLPLLLAAILIAATVPAFLERRATYTQAEELLENRKFEEARAKYAQLGDYLDAREKAEKEVPYEKAQYLLSCAHNGDAAGLTLLGMKRSDLPEGEDLGIFLYGKTEELLKEIGEYKESGKMQEEIDAAKIAYAESLVQKAYDSAVARLDKGEYLGARDDFAALGDYQDAPERMKECLYRRAKAVLDFCESYNVRDISVHLSNDRAEKTVVSMPGSVLTKLGSDVVYQLKACFLGDGVEFVYEEEPSAPGCMPICNAIAAEFEALGEYQDSRALANQARADGDFTAEFYELLREGELTRALDWLNAYPEDDIPNRENYPIWIDVYMPYLGGWELHQGDSSLIPFSAGVEDTSLLYFEPRIRIEGNKAFLRIADDDGEYMVELWADLGDTNFMLEAEHDYYYVIINQADHFTYLRYADYGAVLSSCEYRRA